MYTRKKKKKKKEEMNGCFVVSSMIAVHNRILTEYCDRLRLAAKYFFSTKGFLCCFCCCSTPFDDDTQDDKKTDLARKWKRRSIAHHRSVKKESERNALRDENSLHFSFSLTRCSFTRLNALSLSLKRARSKSRSLFISNQKSLVVQR